MDKTKTLTEFKAALRSYANTEQSRSSVQPRHTAMSVTKQKQPTNTKGGQCLSCGKQGHTSRNCRSKSKLHCTYCQKSGHVEMYALPRNVLQVLLPVQAAIHRIKPQQITVSLP